MIKALRTKPVQNPFTRMSKRRVPQVMPQRNGLSQILIQTQCLRNGSGILRHLQRVRHPRPVMVTVRCDKNLRFVLQPPKGF